MARRAHHYRRRSKEPPELNITTFLNLMVVLVPFLLITAVFSRITITELNLPTSSGGPTNEPPKVTLEVIVREHGLEMGDGRSVFAAIPKREGKYDLEKLSEHLQRIKREYPEKEDATVLMEPEIAYDHLIHVMDAVRVAELRRDGEEEIQKLVLFPAISIGDAP